jgi:hypothetical protein
MVDWTDFEAVLGELTTPLPRQTVRSALPISTAGQGAYVIVGTLADLAATAGLPLGDKANAAIAIGMVADDHMAAEIHERLRSRMAGAARDVTATSRRRCRIFP